MNMPSDATEQKEALRRKLAARKEMATQRANFAPLMRASRSLDDELTTARRVAPPPPARPWSQTSTRSSPELLDVKMMRGLCAHGTENVLRPEPRSSRRPRSPEIEAAPRAISRPLEAAQEALPKHSEPATPAVAAVSAAAAAKSPAETFGRRANTTADAVATASHAVAAAVASTAGFAASTAMGVASVATKAAECLLEPPPSSRLERVDMLEQVTMFSGIPSDRMLDFADSCTTKTVQAGDIIIMQNSVGDEMYVVEFGRLQATLELPDGSNTGVVAEYRRGSYFGELALLMDATRAATVTATEASRVLVLRRDVVSETLQHAGLYHILRTVPMFAGLGYLKLHKVASGLVKRSFAPSQVVIKQGDTGDAMYVVESGRLEASVIAPDGKDIVVVKTYAAGEFFGELALVDHAPRAATITSVDDSILLELRRDHVAEAIADQAQPRSIAASMRNTYKLSEVIAYDEVREHYCCGAPGIVIAPDVPFSRVKDAVMTILILFSCFWEPYKAAFAKDDVQTTGFEQMVNIIYWADIVLSFITGYELLTHTELKLKNIARNYLKGWFTIDLLATFDWEWLFQSLSSEEQRGTGGQLAMVRLLRLVRLLRILKMGRIVERLSEALRVRSAFIKIFNLVLAVVLVVHLVACFFYLVPSLTKLDHEADQHRGSIWAQLYKNDTIDECYAGPAPVSVDPLQSASVGMIEGPMYNSWVCDMGISPNNADVTDRLRYLTAVYFSITTISTIGYGDISPNTNSEMEMLFTAMTEFVGMFIFSYVVTNISTLFSNLDQSQKEFQARLDRYIEYMRDKSTPEDLAKRVVNYLNYREASKFSLTDEDESLLCQLSPGLRMEMHQSYYRDHLTKILHAMLATEESIPQTARWKDKFIDELALRVEPIIAMPHDLIVHRGEPGDNYFFIILEGAVQVYGNSLKRRQTIDHHSQYPIFGVAEMFADQETLAALNHRSVRAKGPSPVDLARISTSAFDEATKFIPEAREAFQSYGVAELHGVLNLDLAVSKKDLQAAYDRVLAKYDLSSDERKQRRRGGTAGLAESHDNWRLASKADLEKRRITAAQLSELVSDLGAELVEPNLSRAMDMMDATTTDVECMMQSWDGEKAKGTVPARTVDFDHFYRWWTDRGGNFTDPVGFCDLATARPIWRAASGRKSIATIESALKDAHVRGGDNTSERMDVVENKLGITQTGVEQALQSIKLVDQRMSGMEKKLERLEQLLLRALPQVGDAVDADGRPPQASSSSSKGRALVRTKPR